MYCYRPDEIPPSNEALAFAIEFRESPPAQAAPGAPGFPLGTVPQMAIEVVKYACNKIVWPSLADFCYATFPIMLAQDNERYREEPKLRICEVNRASVKIATDTRRGRGNVILTSRTTKFNFHHSNPYANFDYVSHIGYLDGLADNDVLVLYVGSAKIDGGFYWHPNEDGTVSTLSWPKTEQYGKIVRFLVDENDLVR